MSIVSHSSSECGRGLEEAPKKSPGLTFQSLPHIIETDSSVSATFWTSLLSYSTIAHLYSTVIIIDRSFVRSLPPCFLSPVLPPRRTAGFQLFSCLSDQFAPGTLDSDFQVGSTFHYDSPKAKVGSIYPSNKVSKPWGFVFIRRTTYALAGSELAPSRLNSPEC